MLTVMMRRIGGVCRAVSYTLLTLPTYREVEMLVLLGYCNT